MTQTRLPFALTALAAALTFCCHGALAAEPPAPASVPADATAPAPADAATPPAAKPKGDLGGVQKVQITGERANDTEQRRNSSAGKLVFGREELDRNGDSTLGEVLKRLPGVTLGGHAGRGGEIRFRGLGNGYTQILLNGERAPRGFSVESLSPDQVEKIEIIRGPVAEYSTQAIAGTINIVLREGYQQKDTQIRMGTAFENGHSTSNVSITQPGKSGNLTYSLTGSLFDNRSSDHSLVENREFNPAPSLIEQVETDSNSHSRGLHFTPRFSYRWDNGDTLVVQPLIVANHNDSNGVVQVRDTLALPVIPQDPNPPYARANYRNSSNNLVIRTFGNWQQRLADSAKLNVKFGFGHVKSDGDGLRLQYGSNGQLQNTISDNNNTIDDSFNIGGKYTAPLEKLLGKGHLLAIGWDAEWGKREQSRTSLNNGVAEFAESGDDFSAKTRRISMFVQDEWDITEKWSTNLGLRWEGIHTSSVGSGGRSIDNSSGVYSPVLHNVWRLPGETKDQVRLGLTRSYRAPTLNDLIAVPSLSRLNSATRPDSVGNPNLQPELATGVDLAFEHYLSRSGIMSVNLFRRNLTQFIRRTTTLQNGRWVSSPTNLGKANTSGIELEAKFQMAELMENAPQLDFRLNYSRFWSRVEAVPGPDNTLDGQARQTANFGLDYRLPKSPLTIGGGYNWTPGFATQRSVTEHSENGNKRQLDLYALWKFSAGTQLRISGSNLLHRDADSAAQVSTNNGAQTSQSTSRTYATLGIRLEFKI
jgi:iron complex outermembrane receptor protein